MTRAAHGGDPAPTHAMLDAEDRLTAADPMIAALNTRAGGELGEPLALPQLAIVARLARRLGIPVAREILVADEDGELMLRVRAEPDEEGIRLVIGGWRDASVVPVDPSPIEHGDGWRWRTDAALRLTFIAPQSGCVDWLGRPFGALFAANDGDDTPLEVLLRQDKVEGLPARLTPTGDMVVLSAVSRTDVAGAFAGLSGVAEPPAAAPEQDGDPFGTFLRGLDSALRAPLARMVANAESIAAQAEGPIAPDYASYAADIAGAGRHLMGLVDDLADLEAVERGVIDLHIEAVDLADAARRAAGLLSARAANAGIAVTRPQGEAAARGDPRRVLQILVNLIGNALRYSAQGGAVTVSTERAGLRQRITVADRGKGIAPGDQSRIFAKFERLDPSEPGGSGLGLYIARQLARAMGGDLTVESAPGEGARFTLDLPAAR